LYICDSGDNRKMVTLKEVFRDFEVIVKGRGHKGKYEQLFKVEPKRDPNTITLDDLRAYVESLKQKYPNRGFKLRKYRNLHVIDQDICPQEHYQEKEHIVRAMGFEKTRLERTQLINAMERYITLKVIENLKERLKELRKNRKKDRIPLYFDLSKQKVYVPKSYVLKNRPLVNYICMRTLGTLGMAQSKYQRMVGRVA